MENNLEKVIEENQISTDEALAKRKMFLRKQSRLSGQFNSCWGILDNFSKNRVTGSFFWIFIPFWNMFQIAIFYRDK